MMKVREFSVKENDKLLLSYSEPVFFSSSEIKEAAKSNNKSSLEKRLENCWKATASYAGPMNMVGVNGQQKTSLPSERGFRVYADTEPAVSFAGK